MPPESAVSAPRPPLRPRSVLLAALVLPGMGQVLNNMPQRGVIFVFFMLSLGVVSFHLTSPEQSFLGRHAGGFVIYAISLVDAYRLAVLRWKLFHLARRPAEGLA